MKTIEVVEAAIIPELLYSVSEHSLKDKDANQVLDALTRDVNRFKDVLPNHARNTFDRHVDKTCREILLSMYDKQREGWDAVSCFSVLLELCSRLADENKLKVTEDLAFAVRTISHHMAEQHGDVWQGMMKAAAKRTDKVMGILWGRNYYKGWRHNKREVTPCSNNQKVEIRTVNGEIDKGMAGDFMWKKMSMRCDILEWRPI